MDMSTIILIFVLLAFCFVFILFLLTGKSKKRKCPNCNKEITDSVITCKHCKTIVDISPKPATIFRLLEKHSEKEFLRKKMEDQNRRHELKR
jgi:hypothetical protein